MKRTFTILISAFALAFLVQPADAQVRFGAQGNYSTELDLGIGARAEVDVGALTGDTGGFLSRIMGIGSFDYYFPDEDFDAWEVNVGAAVPFDLGTDLSPYAGAAFTYTDLSSDFDEAGEFSTSETGISVLGGLRFTMAGMAAYGEARAVLSDADHVVATIGVLLGGT